MFRIRRVVNLRAGLWVLALSLLAACVSGAGQAARTTTGRTEITVPYRKDLQAPAGKVQRWTYEVSAQKQTGGTVIEGAIIDKASGQVVQRGEVAEPFGTVALAADLDPTHVYELRFSGGVGTVPLKLVFTETVTLAD
ncbi:MAG: hypothetical protein HY331_17585 [Chloroflexi bacterium]|nr:hypothetical protein [Chloroflexota bacterium]